MNINRKLIVIAHRGNSGPAPANTIEAIQQAIELGADMAEIDVRSSRDGVPVMVHNSTLDETTDGEGPVSSFTLSELKKLDAGSWKDKKYAGESIPTFAEALAYAKGKIRFSVDIKDESIIPVIVREIQKADMVDEVVMCGCCEFQAKKVWEADDRLTVLMNMDRELDELAEHEDKSEFIKEYIIRTSRGKLSALNMHHGHVTPELIKQAHLRALPVWAWTVDDPNDMKRLIEIGVDAIYTNWPERLLEIVG
ncbi:hypothetical protein GF312_07890 [Candidatus Poribacteria bacterium]|nr:hypothetical protein [Candidatus Poribacteria bacterium]